MESKVWYVSKTVWFNVLAFVVAIAISFGYMGQLPKELEALVPGAIAIVNLILRWLTNQPVVLSKAKK